MKKVISYLEIIILLIAFICCFIPCLQYRNGLIIDIYVFDANKIMGYTYLVLLIIGIVLKVLIIKKKDLFNKKINGFITNYGLLTIVLIACILYLVSTLYRKNMFLHYGIGFYILIGLFILTLTTLIIKIIINKKKNNRKK